MGKAGSKNKYVKNEKIFARRKRPIAPKPQKVKATVSQSTKRSHYFSLLNIKHNKELVLHLSLKVKTSLLSLKQIHLMTLKSISQKDMHIFSIFK